MDVLLKISTCLRYFEINADFEDRVKCICRFLHIIYHINFQAI